MKTDETKTLSWRSVLLGLFFSALFAVVTVYCNHANGIYLSATQIPVLPFALLIVMVILTNPLCRLIRIIRPLSPSELMIVFIMGFVSGGISTFGLSAQVVPVMGNLFNANWNTDQTEWNQHVEPYISEQFFVAEPGIQKSAGAYRAALDELKAAREAYSAALTFVNAEERLAESEKTLAALSADTGGEAHQVARSKAENSLVAARQSLAEATELWKALIAGRPDLAGEAPEAVATRYGSEIKDLDKQVKERKNELSKLEARAFALVDQFRRGLPEGKRALPGFFPLVDDTYLSYQARFDRMRLGHKALKSLESAAENPAEAIAPIQASLRHLAPLAETNVVQAELARIETELESVRLKATEVQAGIKALSEKARFAGRKEKVEVDAQIKALREKDAVNLEEERKDLAVALDVMEREMEVRQVVVGVIASLEGLVAEGAPEIDPAAIYGVMRSFASFDASLRRYFLSDIPWHAWIPPLLRWGVLIGLTYAILMAFNVLIFRQWAYNEKLIYPLVQIPEELAGVKDEGDRLFPSIFSRSTFWIGFGITFCVIGWNLLCKSQWVPGLAEINLEGKWDDYIKEGPLKGLVGASNSHIFFTMIGLAFLIPQKISFSLWFFTVLYLAQLLLIVGMGYGENVSSFRADYGYMSNFRYSEGAGALVIFSLTVLYKCRRYILCILFPASVASLPPDEQRELRSASAVFLAGSLALILALSFWMGANIWYTIFFYMVVLLITIGLIRAVTEGGILGFQAWCGPFHFIRNFVGMDKVWTAPALFAPLYVYFMVFFFDLKTFIAPAMANSIKIRDDLRLKRLGFHGAIIGGIAVAVVAAVLTEIMMCYDRGADAMNGWFYGNFPRDVFNGITSMSKTPPEAWVTGQKWMIAGAVVMTLLLFFRQMWFWLPHPLGLIMLVNPIMTTYWFSIMLGWLFKSLVTKYGNRHSYARARDIFIGLIVGELIIVALAVLVSLLTGQQIPIHLNRNGV